MGTYPGIQHPPSLDRVLIHEESGQNKTKGNEPKRRTNPKPSFNRTEAVLTLLIILAREVIHAETATLYHKIPQTKPKTATLNR